MDDIKVADEKPLLKTEASEMVKEEDKEPHKVEERSKVLKAEETKDFCKIEEDSKPPKAEQSEEHPKVEEDQASPKVEMCLKTDNSALKLEEGPGSLKLEQSEKCFQKVNQDALKIEEGKDTLPKLENSHGFDPSLEVKCEEKPLKSEVKSDELMDIDGPSVGQMNPEPLLTSDVEDMGRDLLATPLPDDGDAEMDPFVRDSASVAAPPSDLDAGRDVRMTTPDAEDSATDSDEVAACTTNAVGGKIAAPQQVVVKAEPVEMELDSLLNSIEETRAQPQKRRRILMDVVVVPFDRAARAHADAERQQRTEANRQALDQRFAQMQNPKVKKAKNAPVLSLDTVIARLSAQNIPFEPYPIDLEPDIRDVTVRRDFMTQEYGGNSQETFPTIAEKFWRKTGMRYFMYLNLNFNPRCPEIPGAPGLIFSADCAPETDIVLSDSESEGEDEVKVAETSKNTKKKARRRTTRTKTKGGHQARV
ncbi:hypothetical protein K438DRAFT_131217 [Mycena galopus ATCC 62051]|nr:hypothetical protein K438DRAFT_131217 [Mycena galopus ATCC 62051]